MRWFAIVGIIALVVFYVGVTIWADKIERERLENSHFEATIQSHDTDSVMRVRVKSPAGVVLPAELEPRDFVSLPDGSNVECRFVNTKHVVCKPLAETQ